MQWLIPKGSSLQKFPCNIYMWVDCLYLAGKVGILLNTTTFSRNVKQIENSNVIQKHFSGIFKIKSQWLIKKMFQWSPVILLPLFAILSDQSFEHLFNILLLTDYHHCGTNCKRKPKILEQITGTCSLLMRYSIQQITKFLLLHAYLGK